MVQPGAPSGGGRRQVDFKALVTCHWTLRDEVGILSGTTGEVIQSDRVVKVPSDLRKTIWRELVRLADPWRPPAVTVGVVACPPARDTDCGPTTGPYILEVWLCVYVRARFPPSSGRVSPVTSGCLSWVGGRSDP